MKNTQKELLQIKDSVRRLYDAQKKKKEVEKFYNDVKQKESLAISNFMFTNLPNGENSFEIVLDEGISYYTNHLKLLVTRVRTKKIVWLLDKLKSKLSKEVYKDVVDKTYTITDMDGLIKYLKKCGVEPKKFKKYIEVHEHLNETKLNNYYDTGVINKKELEGCYEVKLSEPYIRLTETKG